MSPVWASELRGSVPHCGLWSRSGEVMAVRTGVSVRAAANRPILHMNPNGYLAVLGSDEHREADGDARRCDGWGADGVMDRAKGMRLCRRIQRRVRHRILR